MPGPGLAALLFDVFGTCVDWRASVAREVGAAAARAGVALDPLAFADAWRALYQPSMEEVRSGRRPFVPLDVLHRESLGALLPRFGLAGRLPEAALDDLARAWHRLDPWPDVVPGLARLRRRFVVAPHSNGNVALIVAMARRAGLAWDCVLGAEVVGRYKPERESYRIAVRLLGLAPGEAMMVAAHAGDLRAARDAGLRTAFVARPHEQGPGAGAESPPEGCDVVARDFLDLADRLGA
jgi:2-haloacid dehalogenase